MRWYMPVIYQSFSRRETHISLLDARAGSPPSATELLRRQYREQSSGMHRHEQLQRLMGARKIWMRK
ncbi:MAG: hypothetical protein ACJ8BW_05810 [Ktedonobacteraceae bacterium]